MNTIKEIAESLIARPLTESDGIDQAMIEQTEKRLGQKLPGTLKEFYRLIGNLEMFTSSFESFMPLDELECENDMLIFLDENQGVCCWGVNIHNIEKPMVYMCSDIEAEKPEWYSEKIALDDFLRIIMYLQCAEGGYEYASAVYEDDFKSRKAYEKFLAKTTVGWEKVVNHNGFVAYQKGDKLIWHFSDSERRMEDIIYASARTEEGMEEFESFGFSEL